MHRRGLMAATLSLPLAGRRAEAAPPITVLELFTSQGCSSCPPADAFLGVLSKQPGIIALAWHVDYWNSLGWKDPFARREWTDRQKAYASHLNGEVYTPALVVNGAALVVGSDQAAVRRAIGESSAPSIPATLRRAGSGLEAEVGTTATPVTGLLISYDPEQSTAVGAGENLGRKLVEYRVVRDAVKLERVSTRMVFPAIPGDRGAVLLLQDAAWRVVGAASLAPLT